MLPKDPGKLIAQAHSLGLRALVNLLRERTIKETQSLYTEAKDRLDTALDHWHSSLNQNRPDFSEVSALERKLSDIELENIWTTTASYGNTEFKRVRSEKKGIVGPLNNLINIFGARLRDYFLLMNPLEPPVIIGKQKKRTVWGYDSASMGKVVVAHGGDLPELDLADMIRSHGRELCRKSFIFGVPPNDFNNYALLLVRRLAKYTDYVYTDEECGNKNFLRDWSKAAKNFECADDVLRVLVDELACQYSRADSSKIGPSKVEEIEEKLPTKRFFDHQIARLRKLKSKNARIWMKYLESFTPKKRPILRNRDAEYLFNSVQTKARWEGTRYHNLITGGFPQPYNIESVVLQGDQFLESGEDILIIKELRVQTSVGIGRIDIAVFGRTKIPNPKKPGIISVLRPLAVFENKTRTAFNWDILAEEKKGKHKKVVPKLRIRKRILDDNEWHNVMAEVPSDTEEQQLNYYTTGLIQEYRKITGDESVSDVLKGIILLDSQFDSQLGRNAICQLVNHVIDVDNIGEVEEGCTRILYRSKSPLAERAALVLQAPSDKQIELLKAERVPLNESKVYDPFTYATNVDVRHILYLAASSSSRSGYTAAWIAQYWHGLQYLRKLSTEKGSKIVTVLDLAGVFKHRDLAKVRLRVTSQPPDIQAFFDTIEIVDLSSSVNDFLFNGGNLPDIESLLSNDRLLVITGWQMVEESLPPRLNSALRELERYLVERIHQSDCPSLWFLKPRSNELTSRVYLGRCLKPFWGTSQHRELVTDIVWNLPIRPYTSTQTTPMLDDLRVIVHQTKDSVSSELVEIPYLKDWSARFWSQRSKRKSKVAVTSNSRKGRLPLTAQDVLANPEFSKELIDNSIDLIPWLQKLWPSEFSVTTPEIKYNFEVSAIKLHGSPSQRSGIMSRMEYRRPLKKAHGRRTYMPSQRLVPKTTITRPRHYRRWRKKERKKPNKQNYRPPSVESLEFKALREQTARNVEIRRMHQVVKHLQNQKGLWFQNEEWRNLLSSFQRALPDKANDVQFEDLKEISDILKTDEVTSKFWESMLWIRESNLGNGLRENEDKQLQALVEGRPYLSYLYGNYLFVLLTAVSLRYPDLRIDQLQVIWKSVKSWNLKQIGFVLRERRDSMRHKFDVRAIWANLCKQARALLQIPVPVQSAVRYGQLVVGTHGDSHDYWLFLEDQFDRTTLNSGLWIGQSPMILSESVRWTESDNRGISQHATDMVEEETHNLMVGSVSGTEYVWLFTNDEWQLLGELSIIWRRRSAITRIRGLRIKPCTQRQTPMTPLGITRPTDLPKRIEKELQAIGQMRQFIFNVECILGISDRMYTINFASDGETLEEQRFNDTSDVIELLRRPLVEGIPLQSSADVGAYFTWNPYEDIRYEELQLMQPYVEKRKPYVNVTVPLPDTCEELLDRDPVEVTMTISHDNKLCPLVDGSFNAHGDCWRVTIDGSQDEDLLKQFERPLADFEVVNLIKAGGIFFEGLRYSFKIDFEEDTSSRKGYVFRESRSLARQLDLRPLPAGTFLYLDEEQLVITLRREVNDVRVILQSTISGEIVESQNIIPPKSKNERSLFVDEFKEELLNFVSEYFDTEDPEEKIVDFDGVLDEMERILKDISQVRHRQVL